ncbi:phosphatase PAP2 family protein [uncultured Bifidobacterium sp.]|uniref:phosphatase PAP2 family protein n=1 Tax=uncultured Bifidobacterium sp. TaxID=165187 RepID=UPI002623D2D4|nr:phosphatase PAP2 family protein [uncultured Bifidobacterium sp.]
MTSDIPSPTPRTPSSDGHAIRILVDDYPEDGSKSASSKSDEPKNADRGDSPAELDVEGGLARIDPLMVKPRRSSVVLCLVLAALLVFAAGAAWWLAVRTVDGQSYEDMVWQYFPSMAYGPVEHVSDVFTNSAVVIAMTVVIGVAAAAITIVRRRWRLVFQMLFVAGLCYAATWLKPLLPREALIHTVSRQANSAPSGHTMMMAAAVMILLLAVPRRWRAVTAIAAVALSSAVGLSVMMGQWHRPVDVVMSILIAAAIALLALAFTRRSGMDAPGDRASTPSIQVVGSVLITAGVMAVLYGVYVIWQIYPGLDVSARWARAAAVLSAQVLVCGTAILCCGIVVVMRQLVASPLTRLGVIGAPPSPPKS